MLADPLIFLARDPRLEVYALHVAFGPPSDDDHVRKFLGELLGNRSYALSVDVREARKRGYFIQPGCFSVPGSWHGDSFPCC